MNIAQKAILITGSNSAIGHALVPETSRTTCKPPPRWTIRVPFAVRVLAVDKACVVLTRPPYLK